MSRMYDRIRNWFGADEVPAYIDDATVIVADNVAHYYFDLVDTTTLSLDADFPNQAPPLPFMFLDFARPDHITTLADGKRPWPDDWPPAWGVAIEAHDIAEGTEAEVAARARVTRDGWLTAELRAADPESLRRYLRGDVRGALARQGQLSPAVSACVAALEHWMDVYAHLSTEEGVRAARHVLRDKGHPRWIVSTDLWVQYDDTFPYVLWRWHYGVFADGTLDRPITGYPYLREQVLGADRATVDLMLRLATVLSFHPALLTLSFMHCKNVESREVARPAGGGKKARGGRRQRRPPKPYYLLDIDPMRAVLHHEGQVETVGLERALHICRGHFATYNEDRPLFGKLAGTYWRAPHVRGRAVAGAVEKGYTVHLGCPQHAERDVIEE
ncbi:MAG: hypothetical protein M3Y74_01645 [Chloroflexota bacterium]|nr:hypothetical protein [Chloroflexota bacterium]